MEKPSYKLVGAPCGQHGQYTFYKALRLSGKRERIVAIGDFIFVRIWQDSELISIGELQLLWTDRVSDQTLVSLRLYFLPENTPEGRCQHGEDEVLAINDKVVVRAEDLLSWVSEGSVWRWGLRAVWRGACAPPADPNVTAPLHHTKLDFSDVEREKNSISIDEDSPGVMVFSYPRYCRYRALLARLDGIQADWLRDSLVAALGGYAAPTKNTRILYCKETFEYPELEGHEFVCNHLAPRLKGRPRGRRRRARSRSLSRSDSDDPDAVMPREYPLTPRRLSLRNGGPERRSDEESEGREAGAGAGQSLEERQFLQELRQFHKDRNEDFNVIKHLSLRSLYMGVAMRGGYEAVCRARLWRALSPDQPARARRHYERFLLPFENRERKNGSIQKINGHEPIDTIELHDSPLRELDNIKNITDKRLRTPSPKKIVLDNETGEVVKEEFITKPAEELNREFLDSLTKDDKVNLKISVKPVEQLREKDGFINDLTHKFNLASSDTVLAQLGGDRMVNGHPPQPQSHTSPQQPTHTQPDQRSRPLGRSSLRAVRVKPTRPLAASTAPLPPLRADTSSSPQPALNNFGIHHPHTPPASATTATTTTTTATTAGHSDDEIVEVPYKPKTPEIIDLDEYPESPQGVKKQKLDILKERGLQVTALPPAPPAAAWPHAPHMPPLVLNPAVQHQIMSQAQLFHMYNILPAAAPDTLQPPKVIQGTGIFGSSGPEKTVYGNPKDPFMPPPHVLRGLPLRPQRAPHAPHSPPPPHDVLDLTCKLAPHQPAVEIVRVPTSPPKPPTPQNLSRNYTLLDGKAVVGSNLEITLVNPKSQTPPKRAPQKRSSNGKFMSAKTPTPPKEYPKPQQSPKRNPITIPTYHTRDDTSPSSTNSRDSNLSHKSPGLAQMMEVQKSSMAPMAVPFMDPVYMSALYSSLGHMDQRQLAVYRDLVASQFRGYTGLLNIGTPTTKN